VIAAAGKDIRHLAVWVANTFPPRPLVAPAKTMKADFLDFLRPLRWKLSHATKLWVVRFPDNSGPISTIYIRRYCNGVFAKDYYHQGVDALAVRVLHVAPTAGRTVALLNDQESQGFKIHGNNKVMDTARGDYQHFAAF